MAIEEVDGDILFSIGESGSTEVLRLCSNGDIKVKGVVITQDSDCYVALKLWLIAQNYIPEPE